MIQCDSKFFGHFVVARTSWCLSTDKKKKKTMIEYVRLKKFQLTFCGIFFINVTKLCTCFQVQWNLTIYVIIPLKVRIPVVNLL